MKRSLRSLPAEAGGDDCDLGSLSSRNTGNSRRRNDLGPQVAVHALSSMTQGILVSVQKMNAAKSVFSASSLCGDIWSCDCYTTAICTNDQFYWSLAQNPAAR
jgi:hypothetical protein